MKYLLFFLFSISFLRLSYSQDQIDVVVFTKTNGYRHQSIQDGVLAIWKMSIKNNWNITFTEDSLFINNKNLRSVECLIFLNTTLDVLGLQQEKALEKYIRKGGGFVGVHAASDTEFQCPFYIDLIGAHFENHPKTQEAKIIVHHENEHPAIEHLQDEWIKVDEWYNFKNQLPETHIVLLELDETTIEGKKMNAFHPLSWYHEVFGGRMFYTALGHTPESYTDEMFLQHLENGIKWTIDK